MTRPLEVPRQSESRGAFLFAMLSLALFMALGAWCYVQWFTS